MMFEVYVINRPWTHEGTPSGKFTQVQGTWVFPVENIKVGGLQACLSPSSTIITSLTNKYNSTTTLV
jgi:hypothetical protein